MNEQVCIIGCCFIAVMAFMTAVLTAANMVAMKKPGKWPIVLEPGAYWPKSAHEEDAGYDLRLPYGDDVTVPAGGSVTIDTGVHIGIPDGYCGFLKSKSGLYVKYNITGEGVIDAGYTGTIVAKLVNRGTEPYTFKPGEKIIQIVFLRCEKPKLEEACLLVESERGTGGFGSTGK